MAAASPASPASLRLNKYDAECLRSGRPEQGRDGELVEGDEEDHQRRDGRSWRQDRRDDEAQHLPEACPVEPRRLS